MRILTILAAFCVIASGVSADPTRAIDQAVRAVFTEMPDIEEVSEISGYCGATMTTNPDIIYCTNERRVYVRAGFWGEPQAPYALAHVMGHAAQVQHGVADRAFRAIQQSPQNEDALRSMVTRQVHCLAGVYYNRAGFVRTTLTSLYHREPFTKSYWGRDPVGRGPRVSIGMAPRNEWFLIGQGHGDPLQCSVEEVSAEPLARGLR